MPEFPYFPLYPTDLLGDDKVIGMNLSEFGAYVRLLCLAWQRTPPATIPSEDCLIAKLLGVTASEWARLKPAVLPCWQLRGGLYHNKRLAAVHAEMMEKRLKRQEAGRLGGLLSRSSAEAMLKRTGDGGGGGGGGVVPGGSEGGANGEHSPPVATSEVPTLAECRRYADNPACGFPPELVEEWFNKASDRGWGRDWRARMRGAVATYRTIQFERKTKKQKTNFDANQVPGKPLPERTDGDFV
jgi:uncharacterized protein YdaU (DUF1376 family)